MKMQEERPHFSASQLITYLQCPLSYYFQYELGLAWKSTPSAVAFGKSVHEAVEAMNSGLMIDAPLSKEEVAGEFVRHWTANVEQNEISWKKPEESAELLTRGQTLMELYHDQFSNVKPEAVELQFRLPILDPTTGFFIESRDVVGKIDAVLNNGGKILVEVKTTGKSPVQAEIDANLQITLYSWAYRMLYGASEDRIEVVALVKTKEPKIRVVETQRDELDYTRLIMLMAEVIDCIDKKLFYPNPIGGFGCGNCQYRSECKSQWPI